MPLALGAGGDDSFYLVLVKNMMDEGNVVTSTRLGAPFGANFCDFPAVFTMRFDLLVIRLFTIFSANPFVAVSLYYISLPMLIGVSAFLSLHEMGMNRWISAGGAICFAFLPFYFFRGLGHFGLTTYEFVPLAFLLCVWGYRQEIFSPLTRSAFFANRRNWLALLFCVLIANNGNGYWAPFSCFFLLMTAVFAFWDTGKRMMAAPCLIAIGLITVFFLISISPSITYRIEHGKNPMVGQRAVIGPEVFGLKIAQLVIPYEIPGDTAWERETKEYHDNAPLVNENRTSYLGLIGTIGFFALLFHAFRLQAARQLEIVELFTRLNLAGTLLALIGGLATVFTVVIGKGIMLRAYNRISVFLGFLAISAVCFGIDRLWRTAEGWKKYFFVVSAGMLFVAHFALLYPWVRHDMDFGTLNSSFQNNRQFIADIESELPAGAMVYQMPYYPFPEPERLIHRMEPYQLFTGFLHSDTLRWSYGAMKGRGDDAWQTRVAALPLEERLKVLSFAGFSGVYVERRAYTVEEREKLEGELAKRLQVEPLESADRQMVFYSMASYNKKLLEEYTKEEQTEILNELFRGQLYRGMDCKGIYMVEQDTAGHRWQWMDRVAEWEIVHEGDVYLREMTVTIAAGAAPSAHLKVTVNEEQFSYTICQEGTRIVIPLRLGGNRIRLETDAPKVYAPQDGRSMYMRFLEGYAEDDFLPPLLVPEPHRQHNDGGIS